LKKSIVFTGGGTAGHVMPNIAIYEKVKKVFDNVYYIGTENGIEHEIIKQYRQIRYYSIDAVKFVRKLTLKNLLIPLKLINSIKHCKKILKDIKPAVVFSKGGFVAVPVVIAAASLGIPVVAHESDSSIGLANKIIYKKCNKMFFSFSEAMRGYEKKGVYSGSPVREEFLKSSKGVISVPLNKLLKTILIVGGSLGAKAINECIISSLDKLQDYNIINIVGKGNVRNDILYPNYHQLEFVNNISDYYKQADIVISRAGSNVIFELLALKKPMILIPLPKTISRGDQIVNARIFKNKGYAVTLNQENLTTDLLLSNIKNLIKEKEKYISNMSNSKEVYGVETIYNELMKYI